MKDKSTLRGFLDVASSVAVLLAAGAVLWAVFARPAKPGRPELPQYQAGEDVHGVPSGTIDRRLVLFVQSSCRFCTESMPFYKRLAEENVGAVSVIGYESTEKLRAYIRAHGLDLADVRSAAPGSMKISGTPTLLLVDRDGKLIRSWKGRLTEGAEQEVALALRPSS